MYPTGTAWWRCRIGIQRRPKCSAGYYDTMEVAEWDTLQSTTMEEPPMMNTTATTNATSDTNATRATVEEQQQQQQTTSTIPALLLE